MDSDVQGGGNFLNLFTFILNKHFESSQKLRKDVIGIWENFIRNMLSNYMLCTSTGTLYMLGLSQIMLCPCPSPIFKMYSSEILYETESSFEIENKWKVTDILLAIDISETKYRTNRSF